MMPNESISQSQISDKETEIVWKSLVSKLITDHKEFPTTPINRRTPIWFTAKAIGQDIYISNAKEHLPSCKISAPRKLKFDNFKKVYPLYLRRINGESVSSEVTAITLNQVYYFSLIKHLS